MGTSSCDEMFLTLYELAIMTGAAARHAIWWLTNGNA
jgi:hypothetical protein